MEAPLESDDVGFASCVTCKLDGCFDGLSTTITLFQREVEESRIEEKKKVMGKKERERREDRPVREEISVAV